MKRVLFLACMFAAASVSTLSPHGPLQASTMLQALDLDVTDSMDGECVCRSELWEFTYYIAYGNSANAVNVDSVVLVSHFPYGAVLQRIGGDGTLDGEARTVTWDLGTLAPGDTGTVSLVMWAYRTTPAGTNLVATCEIAGDDTPVSEASDSVRICAGDDLEPLVIRKTNNLANSCQIAGGVVSHLISFTNPSANCYIRDIYITDYLSPQTIHVAHSYGGEYDPVDHKVVWHRSSMGRGHSGQEDVDIEIAPGVPPGTEIITRCEIIAESTMTSEAYDTVLVCQGELAAFTLAKSVDPSGGCQVRGTSLTYTLAYENINGIGVPGVTLIDHLPSETDFVSATGGGVYDGGTHSVTWDLGTVPAAGSGSPEVVARITADAESWRLFNNYCEIAGEGVGTTESQVATRVCGAHGNPGVKVAVHVEPHASRGCTKNFPVLEECHDIQYVTDSTDVDAFPVFFNLAEYAGLEYGLTWPGSNTCTFTSCSDLEIGSITDPGDGISQVWSHCRSGPIGVGGWAWIQADGPGEICVVREPSSCQITVGDCQYHPRADHPEDVYCAGVGGVEVVNPCGHPTKVEPTTWGEIKAMYR